MGLQQGVVQHAPEKEIPSQEALDAHSGSMLFPALEPGEPTGPLGNYLIGGNPTPGSPLNTLMKGAMSAQNTVRRQGVLSNRTAITASMLQVDLIRVIDTAHFNLLEEGAAPGETPHIIATHIEDRDDKVSLEYGRRLDGLLAQLAGVDRADEEPEDGARHSAVLSPRRDEDPEPSDELILHVAGMNGQALVDRIRETRFRLQRLRFEWVSSMIVIDELVRKLH
ncbi:MAG TPA: hypothetical protein VFW77_03590 [Candidatus Saccharimonadales bacterium]|nr:hypothetical protein [Candidatus Saccharimonadales bacterium]